MVSLYNMRHSGDQFRCSKFDEHFDLEASYLLDAEFCECPAGVRPKCRHREMLPKFIKRDAIGSNWFFDYDRGGWVQGEALLNELASAASTPPGITTDEDEVEIYEPSASYADGRWPINAGVDAKDVTPKRSAPNGTTPLDTKQWRELCRIATIEITELEPHSPTVTTTGFDPVDDGSIPSVVAKVPTIRRRI